MTQLPMFVSAGEALTDLIRTGVDDWTSQMGGAGWNVARAMARLGVPSAFAGAVSQDVFGKALHAATLEAGLDERFIQQVAQPPLLAVVFETAPPQYFFIGENSADLHFDPARLPSGWQRAARWVHFGGISLARPPLAGRLLELARTLKAQGVAISYDPNFRAVMDASYDPMLAAMGELADVIKVSDEDLCGLYRTTDVAEGLARLRAACPQALCLLTRGAAGAALYRGQKAWRAAAPKVDVADTIGAGDASAAALLYSLMMRRDVDGGEHLRMAVAAGAAACTKAGATPPTLAEIEALLPGVAALPITMET
jgi:fructokinase